MEAIRKRRAVRAYTDRKVERATVEELLNAAVQAPSAFNQQPWAFAVIQDPALLAEYAERAREHWAEVIRGDSSWGELLGQLVDRVYDSFYDASTLIIVCAKSGPWNPAEDCCLAAENLMLAACSMGLATCPVGFARQWLSLPEVKRDIGIPDAYTPVLPILVGYAREEPPAPSHRAAEILVWKE